LLTGYDAVGRTFKVHRDGYISPGKSRRARATALFSFRTAASGSSTMNLLRHLRSGSKPPLKRQELKTFHQPSGDLHMILILESIKPAAAGA
jgi:hypothetical protein